MEKTFGGRGVSNGVLQLGISRVRGRRHARDHAALSLGGIPCVWEKPSFRFISFLEIRGVPCVWEKLR